MQLWIPYLSSFLLLFGLPTYAEHTSIQDPVKSRKLDKVNPLEENQSIAKKFEAGFKSGKYCVILEYSDIRNTQGTPSNSTDKAMTEVWKYHNKLQSQGVIGVNSINGLISALKNCKLEQDIVIDTHGFAEGDGGFCVAKKECITTGTEDFGRLAQALAGRNNVHIWACSTASSAIHNNKPDSNFVNQLVNKTYDLSIAENSSLIKKGYKPRFVAYSRVMYASESAGFMVGNSTIQNYQADVKEAEFVPDDRLTPHSNKPGTSQPTYPVAYSFQVPKGGLAFLEPHLLDYAEKKGFVSHEEAQWARIKRVARLNPNPLKLGRITIYE